MSDNFLDLAMLDEIPDQVILDEGSKHTVQIVSAELGESGEGKKTEGQKYLLVRMKSLEEPDSRTISDVFMLPFKGEINGASLDKEQFNMRGRQLRGFFKCFSFDYASGADIWSDPSAALKGLEGEVIVTVEETESYGEQNNIKKYI